MSNPIPNECECCSNKTETVISAEGKKTVVNELKLFMTMWMCPSCVDKNKQLQAESESKADIRVAAERERSNDVIAVNAIIKQSQTIDAKIEVKTDIFNAETVALIEIQKSVQSDTAIPDDKKFPTIVEECLRKFQLYKEKIFANSQENVDLANKQNAIQKYLNEIKNKLTEAEREKYKLLDANYKPNQVKIANKPINSPAKPKKYDKAEIAKAAARANVPTSVIQMICVAKNMTPMQASDSLLNAGSKSTATEN